MMGRKVLCNGTQPDGPRGCPGTSNTRDRVTCNDVDSVSDNTAAAFAIMEDDELTTVCEIFNEDINQRAA